MVDFLTNFLVPVSLPLTGLIARQIQDSENIGYGPLSILAASEPVAMATTGRMFRIKLRKGDEVVLLAIFHPRNVRELEDMDMGPPPSTELPRTDFLYLETDDSLFASRSVEITIWFTRDTREDYQVLEERPVIAMRPGSHLVALKFPFSIFGLPITRYYTPAAADRIWEYCQQIAEKYGINVECEKMRGPHPIHLFAECCFLPWKKHTPFLLRIPENLSREQYLVWIEQFMRDIYELLLNKAYKPLGPGCLAYACGVLEENAAGAETFRAKYMIRPVFSSQNTSSTNI